MFVDSDDYIEKYALDKIAEEINNNQSDIITIRMLRVLPDGEFIVNDSMLEGDVKELDTYSKKIQWLVEKSENSWSAVRYIIKNSLIQMNNLSFQKGILHEDLDWSAKIFMLAKNMEFIVEPLYYYRIGRAGSITTVIKAKRITDILDTVKRFCLRENSNSELSLLIHRELINSAFRSMQDYPYVKKEEKQNVKAAFAKNREYLNGSNKKSVKILLKISDIFGIDVAFLLVNVAAKIRRRRDSLCHVKYQKKYIIVGLEEILCRNQLLNALNLGKNFFQNIKLLSGMKITMMYIRYRILVRHMKQKKYAFVSDYARFDILYHEGGVYFDTDVEVIKTFDDIISKGGFMGCEKDGVDENTSIAGSETIAVAPGLGLATEAGTELYQEILHYYETQHFLNNDGSYNQETVVTKTTNLLFQYGLKNIKGIQYISGVTIYPKDFFNPYSYDTHKLDITENSRSIHRYDASWKTKGEKRKEAFLRIIGEKNASRLVRIKNMLKGN